MEVREADIPGMKLITPPRYEDDRGFFEESWSAPRFGDRGLEVEFVQDNHSFSASAGTLRGLHFQAPPHVQIKLVRVVLGSLLDIVVDLRRGSPTYREWRSVELSAAAGTQVLVPAGCAHGFCTLKPDTHVLYKVSHPYARGAERGIRWDDPDLAIDWPATASRTMSAKDRELPLLADLEIPFRFNPHSPIHGEPT